MRGAAWAAPTAVVMTAAPAYAASDPNCPTAAQIDAAFAERRAEVSTYDGCGGVENPTFTIWYDALVGINGYLSNSYINVRNQNACTIDMTKYPLTFRIDIVNLSGPDRHTERLDTLQRSLTMTNGYGFLNTMDAPGTIESIGIKTESLYHENGTEVVNGQTRTVYSLRWNVRRARSVAPGEDMDVQFSWADGDTSAGRLTNSYRLVPLGLAAPSWPSITNLAPEQCPNPYDYYTQKVDEWFRNGYGCNPNVTWDVATNVSVESFRRSSGYTRTEIPCGTGIWSHEATDFGPSHDGIY